MSEEKMEGLIRGFVEAFAKGDVEKTLSFLAEDAVWVAPEGTFRGKEEIRRLVSWSVQSSPEKTFRDSGIGIMVMGDKAVYEYVFGGVTSAGTRFETPGICVYEFSGEKIQQHRALYDRMSLSKQAAPGWFANKAISYIVNQYEKGLR